MINSFMPYYKISPDYLKCFFLPAALNEMPSLIEKDRAILE